MEDCKSERGQVLPLIVLVMAVAALGAIGLGRVASAAIDHASATTAADAAALAGVADGHDAAHRVAGENGATIVSYQRLRNGDVRVVARYGTATAKARARCGTCAPGFSKTGDG